MNPISIYELIDVGYPWRLRGPGNQQNDVGLIYPPISYTQRGANAGGNPASTAVRVGGLVLGGFSLHNRAGGTQAGIGIGVRIPNTLWQAGQWTHASTTFTDDTTDAQSTAASDFPVETTTDNDGYVILSRVPFNALSIDVATTSAGAAPVRAARYSTIVSGTSAWSTAMANMIAFTGSTGQFSITATTASLEGLVVFNLPADFTASVGLDGVLGTGINAGWYALNIRSTTAPTGAASADSLSVYRLNFLTEQLADNGVYEMFFGSSEARLLMEGDALVGYFDTANDQNRLSAFVRSAG